MFWRSEKSHSKSSAEKPGHARHDGHAVAPISGMMTNCTDDEKLALNELCEEYKPKLCIPDEICRYDDDTLYLRFLRARQFSIEKSRVMFEAQLKWRKDNFVEDETAKPIEYAEHVRQHYRNGYHGVDRNGRPVFIDCIGKADVSKVLKVVSIDQMMKLYVQQYEILLEIILPCCTQKAGYQIEQTITIVDMTGLGLRHLDKATRTILSKLSVMSQENYPETLGQMVIVNAPSLFSQVWSLVKKLVDEHTSRKISIHSTHSTHWKSHLLELISPDQLPERLGGSANIENWGSSCFGPWNEPEILKAVLDKRPYIRDLMTIFVNDIKPDGSLAKQLGLHTSKALE